MINHKRIISFFALLALIWLTVLLGARTQTNSQVTAVEPVVAVSDLTPDNLLREVNEERVKVGVTPLQADQTLLDSAQAKADEIERTGVFEHLSPDGKRGLSYITERTRKCVYYSENLAADTTAQGAVNDWLGSTPHREAMLNSRYDTTGFGISDGPGYQYVVQHFCDLP